MIEILVFSPIYNVSFLSSNNLEIEDEAHVFFFVGLISSWIVPCSISRPVLISQSYKKNQRNNYFYCIYVYFARVQMFYPAYPLSDHPSRFSSRLCSSLYSFLGCFWLPCNSRASFFFQNEKLNQKKSMKIYNR